MNTDNLTQKLTNRWLVLILILCIALLNYADRYLLAGLAEPVKAEFALSDSFMGLLLGPAFALLFTVMAIPIARLADRMSRILIITLGCAVWSGFTILSGMATSPWMLASARIGVGIGEAAYQAPAAALIAAYFPVQQRGRAFAVLGTAVYFGQMLGYAGGPAIAADHGWRAPFELLGATGIIVAAIAYLIIREPQRAKAGPEPDQPLLALWPLFKSLWAARSFRNLTVGMGFGTLSGVAFAMWGPALFERAYNVPNEAASTTFGLAFGIPGLIGMMAFGVLADRLARQGMRRPVLMAALALAAATVMILAVTWAPNLGAARMLAIPSGLLGGGWAIGVITGLQYILPERHRATGTALALLIMGLMGNVAGPYIAGVLSDVLPGEGAQRLRLGLTLIIPLGVIGSWLMLRAGRTIEADRALLNDVVVKA